MTIAGNTNQPPIPERLTLRTDMTGVYSGRVTIGGHEYPRHYRVTIAGDGLRLEDATEHIALKLIERSKAAVQREKGAQRVQIVQSAAKSPERHRADRGEVVREFTERAGLFRTRALTPIAMLANRGVVTPLQFEVGRKLRLDAEAMAGARESAETPGVVIDNPDGRCWEDFAIEAGHRFNAAKEACRALEPFDGIEPWPVLEAIVLNEQTLTDVAGGSTSKAAQTRVKVALRRALEAAAPLYSIAVESVTTQVLVQGAQAPIEMTQEIDDTWRAMKLNGRPWVAIGKDAGEVYKQAKDVLLDLVKRKLGPQRHPVADVYRVLGEDRRQAVDADLTAKAASAERISKAAQELEDEKKRVLRSRGKQTC
ncbi:hypothetical protein [Azospirillum argentinense]|uniref:hypothetical protein n=1 Tax=Azospirillum argentinense TaxID=2970906 RepID=UPI0032E0279E